jgi:hypothetical protein
MVTFDPLIVVLLYFYGLSNERQPKNTRIAFDELPLGYFCSAKLKKYLNGKSYIGRFGKAIGYGGATSGESVAPQSLGRVQWTAPNCRQSQGFHHCCQAAWRSP